MEKSQRSFLGPAKTDTAEVDASYFLQHEGNWLYVFALIYIQYFLLDLLNAEFPSRVDKAMQSNGCDKKIEWAEAKSVLKLIFHWPDFWEPSTQGGLHWCEVLCDAEILVAPFFSREGKKIKDIVEVGKKVKREVHKKKRKTTHSFVISGDGGQAEANKYFS